MGGGEVIRVSAALVVDDIGRLLVVKKRGTFVYMQPGGKPEAGETAAETLSRELREEIGARIPPHEVEPLGQFVAAAANEAGATLVADVFRARITTPIAAAAEIDDVRWVHPDEFPSVPLAPLITKHMLPLMQSPRTVLVTGFEPFGGDDVNPSGDVARALDGTTIEGATIVGRVLPVSFAASAAQLEQLAALHSPALIVSLGFADGREAITPERVAINYADARIPDNDGDQPRDRALDADGPAARFTRLPVKRIVRALTEAGHPATVSLTAGSYVCNALAYHLGAVAERHQIAAGFIHVPKLPEATLTPAIRLAIATALTHSDDIDDVGVASTDRGAIHSRQRCGKHASSLRDGLGT